MAGGGIMGLFLTFLPLTSSHSSVLLSLLFLKYFCRGIYLSVLEAPTTSRSQSFPPLALWVIYSRWDNFDIKIQLSDRHRWSSRVNWNNFLTLKENKSANSNWTCIFLLQERNTTIYVCRQLFLFRTKPNKGMCVSFEQSNLNFSI